MKKKLEQGTKVKFINFDIDGSGVICGIAREITSTTFGYTYIVELSDDTREKVKEVYDYSHISILQVNLEEIV